MPIVLGQLGPVDDIRVGGAAVSSVYVGDVLIWSSGVPLAPSDLVAVPGADSSQIDLTWTDNAINETGYAVERSLDGVGGWTKIAPNLPPGTEDFTATNLQAGREYFFRVQALPNSPYSDVASATTANPTGPSDLLGSPVGADQILLGWTDIAAGETGYAVERSPDGVGSWVVLDDTLPPGSEDYLDTGLTPGQTWFYRVQPLPGGTYSNVVEVTTGAVATPTNLVVVPGSNSARLDLSWDDNSTVETGYSVERSPNGSTGWVVIDDTLPPNQETFTDTGLPPDTTWFYRVQALPNSPYSNVAQGTTDVPAAPTNLIGTPGPTQDDHTLDWTDNGVNEVGYSVERSANGVSSWVVLTSALAPDTETYRDDTIFYGETWFYRVQANPGSDYSNVVEVKHAVDQPQNVAAVAQASDIIRVTWDAVTTPAPGATGYVVERSPDGVGSWTPRSGALGPVTQWDDTGLAPEDTWFYRVQAVPNSPYSAVVSDTVLPLPAPTGLTATPSAGQVQLDWTDNAPNETGYAVEKSATGGGSGFVVVDDTLGPDVETFTETGLSGGVTWFYRVRALPGGTYSGEVSATVPTSEADDVVARLPGLSGPEEAAVRTCVDGMVLDGDWPIVNDIWCLALNGTDFLTGWKDGGSGPLVPLGAPVHTPGQHVSFGAAEGYVTTNGASTFLTRDSGTLVYVKNFTNPPQDNTYFGVIESGFDSIQLRNDSTGEIRPNWLGGFGIAGPSGSDLDGDVMGCWGVSSNNDIGGIYPGPVTSIENFGPPANGGAVPTLQFLFNGSNLNGGPSRSRESEHSLWLMMKKTGTITAAEVLRLRARMLQLLIDLGVTGVPSP